ncbi:hypothetical protein Bbelb_280750 [Branchiostoma belcheri]|nr:hypothetical protein Bbelb_280750 [Branchiostoma belcheri]
MASQSVKNICKVEIVLPIPTEDVHSTLHPSMDLNDGYQHGSICANVSTGQAGAGRNENRCTVGRSRSVPKYRGLDLPLTANGVPGYFRSTTHTSFLPDIPVTMVTAALVSARAVQMNETFQQLDGLLHWAGEGFRAPEDTACLNTPTPPITIPATENSWETMWSNRKRKSGSIFDDLDSLRFAFGLEFQVTGGQTVSAVEREDKDSDAE